MLSCCVVQRVPAPALNNLLMNHHDLYELLDDSSTLQTDLDTSWQALHFLLNGTAKGQGPLTFLKKGGTTLQLEDDEDEAWEDDADEAGEDVMGTLPPARAFTPGQTREISDALAPFTVGKLRKAFDPAAMMAAGVEPAIWDEPIEACMDEYVLEHFDALKNLVQRAAKAREGLLVWVE